MARQQRLPAVVAALGVNQIISFGTLNFTIAVLGPALGQAAGVSDFVVYAMYSAGLVASGLIAPWIGREIDRRGGRPVLCAGSVLAGIACLALAMVQGPATLMPAWLLTGLAMAFTLYEPAFATLHQVAGTAYRRSVTAVTLYGGFASTVFWPLSQALLDLWGVRVTFAIYSALQIGVCLPLHLIFIPRANPQTLSARAEPAPSLQAPRPGRTYLWLAVALTLGSLVSSAITAHQIGLLMATGLTAREAVILGAMIGPMQVVGRFMEMMLATHVSAIKAGVIAFGTYVAALAVFAVASGNLALAVLYAVLYGWSNGVLTVTRGTVPAELFGRAGYGALLGRLAMPQFIARALAPAALAGLLALHAPLFATSAVLLAFGVLALLAYLRAVRSSARDAK